MKSVLLMFLVAVSLIASEIKEGTQSQSAQEEIKYIIDAKNYGMISAKDAFYVIDSHKYGTMQDHFAFATKEDAREHVEKHGGSVVSYEDYMKIKEDTLK